MITTTEIFHVRPDAIDPSPLNPRKRVGPVDDLVASIREVGILQPLTVRKVKADRFELVLGERRLTAAKEIELETVPCIKRDMTDEEVLEAQIVENSQRTDVHPLDEADGFKTLVGFGRTPKEIADKVGRSIPFVVQRLQLCELGAKGRAAFDGGRISLGAAIVLARVPAGLQDKVLRELLQYRHDKENPITASTARDVVERGYSHRLAGVPWKLEDCDLVPKAGPCTTCPKRTGNQRELFDDVKATDVCTDPDCYREKLDAAWAIRVSQAAEKGETILEGKAAAAVRTYNSGYVEVGTGDPYWTGSKELQIRGVVRKAKIPLTVIRDERHGQHREFVREADLRKALKLKGPSASQTSSSSSGTDKRARLRERIALRTFTAGVGQAVAKVEKATKVEPLIALIVRAFAARAWNDAQKAVLRRRAIDFKGGGAEQAIVKLCDSMTPAQRLGLGVELAIVGTGGSWRNGTKWRATLEELGVDVAKIQEAIETEQRERAKSRKAKPKKSAAKEAKPQKGTCTGCGCTESTPCTGDDGPCSWANAEQTLCTACA